VPLLSEEPEIPEHMYSRVANISLTVCHADFMLHKELFPFGIQTDCTVFILALYQQVDIYGPYCAIIF
jgi:hypothetical protein